MKKLWLFLALFPALLFGQTVPNGGITPGLIWTTPQWNNAWMSKVDVSSGTLNSPTITSPLLTGSPVATNLTISGIAGTLQCLHADALGDITGTGSDCGSGGGGGFAGAIFLTASGDTTGVTDKANLNGAIATLQASVRVPPLGSSFAPLWRIIFGPGTFFFTTGNVNILTAANTHKISGVWFEGAGRDTTDIDYNNPSGGPLFLNNFGLNVKFTDMTLTGHNATSDFMWMQEQAGVTNIQDYTWPDLLWNGTWNNIFRLTGGNNNSEWKFDRAIIAGNLNNWVYVPPTLATTITNGSATIVATNTAEQVEIGDTGQFSAAVAPLAANTQYYVVAATTANFQVSLTRGGAAVSFTASGTPNFQTGSDQFLNFWFNQVKFDSSTSLGQWMTLNYGGSVKITDSDISGHNPSSVSYVFNLLGTIPHAGGVMNFSAKGLRMEHAGNNSRLIHSQWTGGTISWDNLDESSQAGLRTLSNAYAFYEIINNRGPQITYSNSQLMGVHNYAFNTNNFNFQNEILYFQDHLLDNVTPATFITVTNVGGNTGGTPRIRFKQTRNSNNASTVGYHEILDTDLSWNTAMGGLTDTKVVSCVGANSDFPHSGGNIQFRLPLNAMITQVRYWNPAGSGGANTPYNYSIQTMEATPTVLLTIAGATSATAIPASAMIQSTPNFVMTTDLARTFEVVDTITRAAIFTNMYCLVDYIG
jgi:hypothetical protein